MYINVHTHIFTYTYTPHIWRKNLGIRHISWISQGSFCCSWRVLDPEGEAVQKMADCDQWLRQRLSIHSWAENDGGCRRSKGSPEENCKTLLLVCLFVPSKIEWDGTLPKDPLVSCWSYSILRFRGPFSGSCWTFLGFVWLFFAVLKFTLLGTFTYPPPRALLSRWFSFSRLVGYVIVPLEGTFC